MLLAAPFLLPRGVGVKGAKKLLRTLRRRGAADSELPAPCCACLLAWTLPLPWTGASAA